MKLSILIPVYNAEEHISRCLDSLLDQNISNKDYEIILRDDGSTDSSASIIKMYCKRHSNIILYRDSNKGAYVQRNLLLEQARGEYIYFLDADDYLVRGCLDKVLQLAIAHELDLCCFNIRLTTAQNADEPVYDNSFELNNLSITTGRAFMAEHLDMRYEIWWYIIKRSFLEDTNISFEESRYHNDVLFTLKLFVKSQRLIFIPQIIYNYFQSQNSIMRKSGQEHAQKLIHAGKKLINDYANYVKDYELYTESKDFLNHLLYNRDKYAFYLILRMVKLRLDFDKIDEVLDYLKGLNCYPTRNYTGNDMPKKKYIILYALFNNRLLLKSYIFFKNS